MIKIEKLTKLFGKHEALKSVDLIINSGEGVILIGQNGAGKTTLIRTLLGEYHPSSGEVELNGINPFKDRKNALNEVAFVPQLPPPIKLTVGELIGYAADTAGVDRAKVIEYCKRMDLEIEDHEKKVFFKLSGGMKQKLLIALAMARHSSVMIFDEPTANLDPLGRERFYEIVKEEAMGRTLLFVSHRTEELKGLASRVIEMDLGKVVRDEKI